jgi:hypothetical protein
MSRKKAIVPLAVIAAPGVLGATSAAWSEMRGDLHNEQSFGTSCSLDGFNPSWHSGFETPALAKQFGFVKSRDGTWQLDKSCAQGGAVPQLAPPHGPRRVKKKQP